MSRPTSYRPVGCGIATRTSEVPAVEAAAGDDAATAAGRASARARRRGRGYGEF
ncbi:hypothetical protein ACNF49_21780 [Actinomadura sp. ATCC 39365]